VRLSSTGDTTPPTAPGSLVATGAPDKATLSWTAADGRQRDRQTTTSTARRRAASPRARRNRIAQPTTTSYVDIGLTAGTYYYKVTADDNAGNTGPASNEASRGSSPQARCRGWSRPYGFDEGSGTTTADQSGNGNGGHPHECDLGPARTRASSANALNFNGSNALVTVADANSLDLTTGVTLEAWVKPSVAMSAYRTVVVKEQPGNLVYGPVREQRHEQAPRCR